ncbi:MAG TPA: hypothetical protein VJ806_14190 [Luteimonas sp.]|nr:hypothetical protein [Luteimonas sp.]
MRFLNRYSIVWAPALLAVGCAHPRQTIDLLEAKVVFDNSIQGRAALVGAVGTTEYDRRSDYLLVIRPTLLPDGTPWAPADMKQATAELKKALPRAYIKNLKFGPTGSCATGAEADGALRAWMVVHWSLHAPKGDFGPLPDVRADDWRGHAMAQKVLDALCIDLKVPQAARGDGIGEAPIKPDSRLRARTGLSFARTFVSSGVQRNSRMRLFLRRR